MYTATDGLTNQTLFHLKSAIDQAAIVAITDRNGIITYVNQKFCDISKYSKDELLGKTHSIINSHYHPKEFFTSMWQTISNGKVWEGEIRNRNKDGQFYWVNTTIVPFLDAQGKPEKYVAVRYEITERKLAEEQLKIYSKKLEVSNKELEEFASVAAHDLQEPLRKIQAFSDRLQIKSKNQLDADAFDYVCRIKKSAERMQNLINDLLTYSRVSTKNLPFSQVDLVQIAAQVTSDLELRLEQSQGEIKIKSLPTIKADPTQMYQLFQNLLSNALKFRKPEIAPKVTIEGHLLPTSPVGRKGAACQIIVRDNGIGFDEKYLDRIFTIFQRLHGKHEYEGTGIGLAVCRKIVDRHGGTITANSRLGEGSEFVITLPYTQQGDNDDK